jgi:hypothetical protein
VLPNYNLVIQTRRLEVRMPRALCPWAALTAGIPLTLLLDLAVGEALDSATILGEEQAHALANTAWAEVASARAERGASGGVA